MDYKAYKCIAIWGHMLGSYSGYIQNEQYKAWLEDAPLTSIYKGQDGVWVTADTIRSDQTRKEVFDKLAKAAAKA